MKKERLTARDKAYLKRLGKFVENEILKKMGYISLDRFHLENWDTISKATLYNVCYARKDITFSTVSRVAKALGMTPLELLGKVKY